MAATSKNPVEEKRKEVAALREQLRTAQAAAASSDPKQVEAAQLAALEREEATLRTELASVTTAAKLVSAGADGTAVTGEQLLKLATEAHKAAGLKVEGDGEPMGQVPASENPALDNDKNKEK